MRNEKGQAILETLFFMPLAVIVTVMLFWGTNYVITRQQLLSAARYGTDILYYTTLDSNDIKEEVIDYLTSKEIIGRTLDKDKIRGVNITDKRSGSILDCDSDSYSKVEIKYGIEVPRLFFVMGKLMGHESSVPGEIVIKGHSVVLAGFQ